MSWKGRHRRLARVLLHAELVAFRVGHDGEVLSNPQYGGAQRDQAGDFLGDRTWRPKIEVYSVFAGLWFGHPVKPHVGAAPAGRFDVSLLGSRIFVDVGAQGRRPEAGRHECVGAVEGHRLDEAVHDKILGAYARVPRVSLLAVEQERPESRVVAGARVKAQDGIRESAGLRSLWTAGSPGNGTSFRSAVTAAVQLKQVNTV